MSSSAATIQAFNCPKAHDPTENGRALTRISFEIFRHPTNASCVSLNLPTLKLRANVTKIQRLHCTGQVFYVCLINPGGATLLSRLPVLFLVAGVFFSYLFRIGLTISYFLFLSISTATYVPGQTSVSVRAGLCAS